MTKEREKPGPKPDTIKIEELDWEEAVKKGLEKPPPGKWWPSKKDGEKQPE